MSRPTAIYLHASGSSGRQWRRWQAALPGDAPDRTGGDAAADIPELVRAIDAAGAPVDLIGHSYGGCLALFAAALRPGSVRRIAVYEPPLFGILDDADRAGLPAFPEGLGSVAWLQAFVDWWNGAGAWARQSEPVRAEFVRVGERVASEVGWLRVDRQPLSTYASLGVPLLVLHGDRSPGIVQRVQQLLGSLPGASRVTIAGAGHLAPVVDPEPLVAEVARFLG